MSKKLLSVVISLIIVLIIALIFSAIDLERKLRTSIYPLKVSLLEKLLASISQILVQQKIEVDLSQQKVKIFEGEKVVDEFLVSTGREDTPTPTGRFRVYNKSLMVHSKIANCWLPFWVGFTPDGLCGFHEIPICEEGRKGLKELGEPASIGCVRLGLEDSEVFYKRIRIGTPVVIYGRHPPTTQEPVLSQDEELAWCHNFKTNLKFGDVSDEVKYLQIALNSDPVTRLAEIGVGSPNNETLYFGPLTEAAVIKFQVKYTKDILVPWNLTKGTGFVGPTTRDKLNQLYGCQ